MKKRFIVLVDFSEHSRRLISYAYDWAEKAGGELLCLHYSTEPVPGFGDNEIRTALKESHGEQALEKLREFTESAVGHGIVANYYVDHYNLSSAVLKLEKKNTTDFIFSGIKHKSPFETLLTGNTAISLAEEVNSIIVAIPENSYDFDPERLYVAVKDGISLNEPALAQLLNIRDGQRGSISFFTALKEGAASARATEYLEYLRDKYRNVSNVTVQVLYDNNSQSAITNHVLAEKGVLVIQKGSRNFTDLFRKYFTTGIVRDGQVPVIILP